MRTKKEGKRENSEKMSGKTKASKMGFLKLGLNLLNSRFNNSSHWITTKINLERFDKDFLSFTTRAQIFI